MAKRRASTDEVKDIKPAYEQKDEDIIAEAKKFLETSNKDNGDNYKEAIKDLKMIAGDHWPEQQKRERERDGRPALVINKLPTFLNQIQNDQRQNKTSIAVSPVSDGANQETAEVLQGIIRHIEYASNADVATDTAVNSAAAIGFGYWRFITKYCSEISFDQDICYDRIRNSFSVCFDPDSTEPDGSDQGRCLIHEKMNPEAFKLAYPGATATTESLDKTDSSNQDWLDSTYIRTGQYYRIEKTPETLVMASDNQVYWKDELPKPMPPGFSVIQERKSFRKKVMLYKLTAIEILERTEIMCDWIPVFPVYGSELDIDGKVIRSGLVRNARDPQMMYDFWMTSATEEVSMRLKAPIIGAKGFAEGFEDKWRLANNRAYPYLEYNPVASDGILAPPPQRQAMADIPNGMLTMAMHSNDNIKATTGLFDSSIGAVGNATSGRQELAQQKQGNVTNFHYSDNLTRTQRHAGRCLVSMIPHYYDTERIMEIMGEDGTVSTAPINKVLDPQEAMKMRDDRVTKIQAQGQVPDERDKAIQTVLNDVRVGKYAVVISVGPSYSTMRKEASDAMVQFGQSWPKLMDVAGDKVVKAMDWPGSKEIAERIERTIPAEIRYDPKDPKAGPPPIPPEVQQQLQQAAAAIKELHEENVRLQSGVDKENIKADINNTISQRDQVTAITVAEINAEAKKDVAELAGMIDLLIKKMVPDPELVTEVKEDLVEPKEDKTALLLEQLTQVVTMMAQKPAPVRRKMSIQAPSGAMYQGEIADHQDEPQPQGA